MDAKKNTNDYERAVFDSGNLFAPIPDFHAGPSKNRAYFLIFYISLLCCSSIYRGKFIFMCRYISAKSIKIQIRIQHQQKDIFVYWFSDCGGIWRYLGFVLV